MTFIYYLLIAALIYFLLKGLLPTSGVKQLTVAELNSELKQRKNKQFIDVRTAGEFKANHIKGFKNIPLQELNKKASDLSKDQEVILICQSGMRSNQAGKILKKMGFNHVVNVKGGMNAWK